MITGITDSLLRWGRTRSAARADGAARANGAARAHTLAVCSRKGGVGKTTSAVHVAWAAATWHGLQVLLVDLDSQGHVETSLSAALDPGAVPSEPLSSVLMGKKRDLMSAATPTRTEGLWVVTADRGMSDTEMLLASRIGREFVLRGILGRAREIFDLVIIDCPPTLGLMTLNALVASDSALVPTDLSPLSLQGIADLADTVGSVHDQIGHYLRLAGILVTRRDGRTRRLNDEIGGKLTDRYGNLLFDTVIPMNSAVGQACARGITVYEHAPRSRGAQEYKKLTGELLTRLDLGQER